MLEQHKLAPEIYTKLQLYFAKNDAVNGIGGTNGPPIQEQTDEIMSTEVEKLPQGEIEVCIETNKKTKKRKNNDQKTPNNTLDMLEERLLKSLEDRTMFEKQQMTFMQTQMQNSQMTLAMLSRLLGISLPGVGDNSSGEQLRENE
jgi:hypothetical protein